MGERACLFLVAKDIMVNILYIITAIIQHIFMNDQEFSAISTCTLFISVFWPTLCLFGMAVIVYLNF